MIHYRHYHLLRSRRVIPRSLGALFLFGMLALTVRAEAATLIDAIPPTFPAGTLPVTVSLALSKYSYELDEYLGGTGGITNPNNAPAPATLLMELYKDAVLVKTVTADFPCTTAAPQCIPVGTIPIKPADVLRALINLDRIPADPALIGNWTLSIRETRSGVSAIALPFTVIMPRPVTVTVDGSQDAGIMQAQNGFLYFRAINPGMIAPLRPKFWRTGTWLDSTFTYQSFKQTNPAIKVTYILGPRPDRTRDEPWLDWPAWEAYVKGVVKGSKNLNTPMDYWDLWSEPNNSFFFTGTREQFFETIKRTIEAAKIIDPQARFVAPSTAWFGSDIGVNSTSKNGFLELLRYLADNNLHLDAISWHDFGMPEDIPREVAAWKEELKKYAGTSVCTPQCPEIHINEFIEGRHFLNPGWTLGWVSVVDKAKIDWASRSCWWEDAEVSGPYTNCFEGFNGLFRRDGVTPQHIYWVHKLYADLESTTLSKSVETTTSAPRSVALASKNDDAKELRVILGRYSCGKNGEWCNGSRACGLTEDSNSCYIVAPKAPPIDTTIRVTNYPYASPGQMVKAAIQRIPNEGIPGPLLAPLTLPSQTLTVDTAGTVILSIPQYQDGDVYSIVLTPVNPAPAISSISPSSGPVGTTVTLTGTGFTPSFNNINFGSVTALITNLSSADGKTLTFTIPNSLCRTGEICTLQTIPPGTYNVSVTNVNGTSNAVQFTVTSTQSAPLTITTSTLPPATVSRPYSATITTTGGSGSYTWSATDATLPPGLVLSPGVCITTPCQAPATLSGIPIMAGTFSFTVRVTDGTETAQQPFMLISLPPPPSTNVFTSRVSVGSDDAEQNLKTGAVNLTSTDLELIK
ncbi:MAG: S-layer protein, partial [Parcubacteria group bacterium Greene0416_14]